MKCACGTSLWTGLLATVGIIGVGVGGYNAITTGCPLGICWKDSVSANVSPASMTSEPGVSGCCSSEAKADGCTPEAKAGCCSDEKAPCEDATEPKIVAPADAPEAAEPVASSH